MDTGFGTAFTDLGAAFGGVLSFQKKSVQSRLKTGKLRRLSRLSHPTLAHLAWQVTSAKTSNFPPDLFAFHFATQIPNKGFVPRGPNGGRAGRMVTDFGA